MTKTQKVFLFVAVALGALATGLYIRSPDAPPLATVPTASPTVFETKLANAAGGTGQLSDWKGKVLVVNFWATWCPPCVTEVPDLVRLQAKYDGQLVILGISDDHGQVDIVKTFAAAKKVNYPLVMNTPALGALFPGLIGLPTTYVIDQQGRIVQKHVGQLNMAKTEAEVQALIEAGAGGPGRPGGL